MKTKKESKFGLEKFEVVKLNPSAKKKIIGGVGLGGDDPIGGQENTNGVKNQGGGNR